ncbi:MAG TPA: hypothetical protein VHY79_20180, partial [Rhizomicrobium sp.]|nr:hypothetical protein [Rhizomicrobium sp.]
LVIEGQPQPSARYVSRANDLSGLVIEGQPQQSWHVGACPSDLSGLVIEGQPQQRELLRNSLCCGALRAWDFESDSAGDLPHDQNPISTAIARAAAAGLAPAAPKTHKEQSRAIRFHEPAFTDATAGLEKRAARQSLGEASTGECSSPRKERRRTRDFIW